jgi:hypothetical protein
MITYFLTLRYQLAISSDWWYLRPQLYEGRLYNIPKLLEFLRDNTYRLLIFTANGLVVILALPAFGIMLWQCDKVPRVLSVSRAILSLLGIAVAVVAGSSILGLYPYGGIRQCIFLTPVIALTIASSYDAIAVGRSQRFGVRWFIFAISIVLIAGAADLYLRNPYAEREDIKTVLSTLESSANERDIVYVHWSAKPALDFYRMGSKTFLFGTYHRGDPAAYLQDFHRMVGADIDHIWIVFSHVVFEEDDYLLEHLKDEWNVDKRVDAIGASLYFAKRRAVDR